MREAGCEMRNENCSFPVVHPRWPILFRFCGAFVATSNLCLAGTLWAAPPAADKTAKDQRTAPETEAQKKQREETRVLMRERASGTRVAFPTCPDRPARNPLPKSVATSLSSVANGLGHCRPARARREYHDVRSRGTWPTTFVRRATRRRSFLPRARRGNRATFGRPARDRTSRLCRWRQDDRGSPSPRDSPRQFAAARL
jgi:hypothetical protein